MLGAGLIKIRGDRCWKDLTCMNYHYENCPRHNLGYSGAVKCESHSAYFKIRTLIQEDYPDQYSTSSDDLQ
ncbi:hypothetical protein scyTo_0002693 [Scyliorhinus torazame]|uniref:Lipase maturation factor n=1 Tax=Scyliorhinus torazame TaxID=75743 RepID=A0A401PKG4_SCYTO|nr:hypothetical protein [Scyliorhinus torazame]